MSTGFEGENQPLLRSPVLSASPELAARRPFRWPLGFPFSPFKDYRPRQHTRLIISIFCLQLLLNFSKYIIEIPVIRLFEIALCDRYYKQKHVAEKLCKISPIQNDLAIIVGWRFFFDALPALLTAIFYGQVADRQGRRVVLFLSCLGLLCGLVWIVTVCYVNVLPVKLVSRLRGVHSIRVPPSKRLASQDTYSSLSSGTKMQNLKYFFMTLQSSEYEMTLDD